MDLPDPGRWVNAAQAAQMMGLPEPVFRSLVKRGVIPAPAIFTRKTKLWQALTIFCCSHLLTHLHGLSGQTPDDLAGEEDDDG